MNIYAVDFETYYDKEYSVVDLGYWGYTNHSKFDAYLVSIVGSDGNEFVGNPKDFDWACIASDTWISHNTSFDSAVYERLIELGIVPNVRPPEWHDTADLVAYLGHPRSLKDASSILLGVEVDKSTRGNMTGKTWDSMTEEFRNEVMEYALKDSRLCLRLWLEHNNKWPEVERQLSVHTRKMASTGLPTNSEMVDASIRKLEVLLWKAAQNIPWATNEGTAILSTKALAEECRKQGIRAPLSLAKDSEDFEQWKDEFSEQYPFAQAMSDYRRINTLLLKFKTMRTRTRPDGYMHYGLKYFGAHTGRWSGDSGFNVQNMPKTDLFEVNLRKCIEAPEGKTLVVCDLSNIEPRCLALLSEDTETLRALRSGMDIYEAHARATLNYSDPRPLKEADPLLRQISKTRVLGLGYGCGWHKFVTFAEQLLPPEVYEQVFGADVTYTDISNFLAVLSKNFSSNNAKHLKLFKELSETKQRYWVNSWKQVEAYRTCNKPITDFWAMLEAAFKRACGRPEFTIELPGGRHLRYRDPKSYGGNSAEVLRLGRMMRVKLHGGLLTENVIQAVARDVFSDCLLRLEKAGYQVIMHAHDEAVCLVDENGAERAKHGIEKIMSTPPNWIPDLPQAAEASITKKYTK